MGKKKGIRDGTGPHKESYQKMKVGIGKRKKKGEVCPIVKLKKSIKKKKKGGKP